MTATFEDGEYYTEEHVRAYLGTLDTGETSEEIETLVPDGDYLYTTVDVFEIDAWAADPEKATALAETSGPYPPIVLLDGGHITDGNHRVIGARQRGDSVIFAFSQNGYQPS
jgi:hypothetical protein